MSKQANKTLIGAFVLGAVGLVVAVVLILVEDVLADCGIAGGEPAGEPFDGRAAGGVRISSVEAEVFGQFMGSWIVNVGPELATEDMPPCCSDGWQGGLAGLVRAEARPRQPGRRCPKPPHVRGFRFSGS